MFPSASIHDSAIDKDAIDKRALDRPGGSPKRSSGQPRQGLIWSLLAMGLAACGGGGGGGGGAVTSGGTTEPAGDGTTEPAAPPPPSGFLAVDESSAGGSRGRTVLVVNFDRLIDQDGYLLIAAISHICGSTGTEPKLRATESSVKAMASASPCQAP